MLWGLKKVMPEFMFVKTYFRHWEMDNIISVGRLLYEVGKVIPHPRNVRIFRESGCPSAFLWQRGILPCLLPG